MPYHPLPHVRPHYLIIILSLLSPPLSLSPSSYLRFRLPCRILSFPLTHTRVLSAFLSLPPFLLFIPCILFSVSIFSSSSRYLTVIFKICFITSFPVFHSRSHTIFSPSFTLSFFAFSFSLSRAHAFTLSCLTKKIVSLTHNSLLLFIIIISLSLIFNSYVFVSFQRNAINGYKTSLPPFFRFFPFSL